MRNIWIEIIIFFHLCDFVSILAFLNFCVAQSLRFSITDMEELNAIDKFSIAILTIPIKTASRGGGGGGGGIQLKTTKNTGYFF